MDERLRKLVFLVEAGSFTKAAARLHVSQPALSLAIKTLERELGTALVLRNGRHLQLTEAGQVVYESALRIDDEVDSLQAKLRDLTGQKPKIAIGMIDSIAEIAFEASDGLALVAEQTQLSLVIDASQRLTDAVTQGKLNVAFVTTAAEPYPASLHASPLGVEPLLLVAHPSQTDSINESLKRGLLQDFISYNQGSRSFELISQHFQKHGLGVQPSSYSTSPSAMLQLVLLQRGAAVLPYTTVANALNDNLLVAIPVGGERLISRPIDIIWFHNKPLPDSLLGSIESLRSLLLQSQGLAFAYASPSV